jgi:hypothetical protein
MEKGNITVLRRVLQTSRACVRYKNIQHISWNNSTYDIIEMKVYTSGGVIIQEVSKQEFNKFMKAYYDYVEMVDNGRW